MISVSSSGSNLTEMFIKKMLQRNTSANLEVYGQIGVAALAAATPKDSGETALSWRYRVIETRSGPSIEWYNENVVNGVNIAVILQYGHGTRGGGYVQGRDYINPAVKPVFDEIAAKVWKEVTSA